MTPGALLAKAPDAPDASEMRSLYKSSHLRIEGSRVVTASGRTVSLHGINVGGWLVTEGWMCGFADSADTPLQSGAGGIAGRSALESLEARFGVRDAAALLAIWQDNWITPRDLDRIRDSGFNLIRVPISYRTLQHADGRWILDRRGKIDFSRMDWIVREAAARGIYTIFDLHVWPQQRSDYEKIGRPDGADIRQAMADLWTAIATHYRGNGAIAAFDLINEFPGNWGVQQYLARAIARADPKRLQVVEGFTFAEFIALHKEGAFPNAIYSRHLYGADPLTNEEIATRLQETANSPVPVYVGEFLAADFAAATRAMNQAGIAWSAWTYKTVDMGEWGMVNYPKSLTTNIQQDSYQQIAQNWATNLTAWQSNPDTAQAILNKKRVYVATNEEASMFESFSDHHSR